MHTRFLRAKQSWRGYDRRYGWKWRALNAAAACLVVVGAVVPIASQMLEAAYYNLSSDTLALVGKTDPTLLKQLSYTGADSTYQFNQKAVATASAASLNHLKQQVGTASGHGSDTSLYGLDVPTNYAKGVTYHDINSQLSFTMAPQFSAGTGKQVDGHLVFPLSLSTRAVYTLKNNGLKEDIVVSKATGDTMSFAYKLQLPKTLEAHKLADGSIGVYSADPSLYGAMTYGSVADRAAIQKARETGEKTHLVFGLPAPVVKNAHGQPVGEAHFDLDGSNLRVVATGLDGVKGTFTIDPSVVVTSTGDFQTGNNEGMISFGTAGQITRDGLTSGAITSTPGAPAAPPVIAAVGASGLGVPSGVTNGSLVVAMVTAASHIGSTPVITAPDSSWVEGSSDNYAYNGGSPITQNNVVVSWWYHYATGSDSGVYAFTVGSGEVMGGYALRITGGPGSGNPFADPFQHADTNADTGGKGTSVTVAGWTPSGNNNLLLGGIAAGSNGSSTVSSVPSGWMTDVSNSVVHTTQTTATATGNLTFNQSTSAGLGVLIGTIRGAVGPGTGGWMATTSLPSALEQGGSVAYNGYLYQIGGSGVTTAQSAPINSDGTIGAWTSAGSSVGAGNDRNVMVSNGYIYEVGDISTSTYAYYATIGNGTIGTWTKGRATPATNNAAGAAIYQNYLYLVGGGPSGGGGSYYTTVYYAPLNADGSVGSWTATTNLPTATGMNTAIAYNGYLYSIGGADTGYSPNVYYAPINADGSIGAWVTTASVPSSKYGQYSYIYDGYIYYVGGWTNKVTYYAPIYANGSLGSWQTTASLISTSGLRYVSGATYNGSMYILGGREESTSSDVATVQYAKISPVATPAAPTVVGSSTTSEVLPTVTGGYKAGDLILHQVYLEPQNESSSTATYNTPTPTAGYSWLPGIPVNSDDADMQTSITQRAYIEYKWATGSETSGTAIPITGTGGDWYGDAGTTVIRGADQAGLPYAESALQGTKGALTFPSLSLTAGGTNNLLLYLGTSWDSGDYASLSGWTQTKVTDAGVGTMLYTTQAAAGSTGAITPVSGVNSNNRRTGVLLSFRAPPTIPPGNDGTIGSWTTTSSSVTASCSGATNNKSVVVYGGYVYSAGNYPSCTAYYAPINANGTIGSWTSTNSAPDTNVVAPSMFALNGYIYQVGGYCAVAPYNECASSYYAPINSNGSLGTWQTLSSNLSTIRDSSGVATYNGYTYILGGDPGETVISYAKPGTNGNITSWSTAALPGSGVYKGAAVAYGGYMYILGGATTAGGTPITTVSYAPINANGSLGTWNTTSSFATGQYTSATAINGYMYIAGGSTTDPNGSSPTGLTTSQYAPINANGTLGAWQASTALPYGMTSVPGSSFTYNGNIYIHSYDGSGPGADQFYYAPLHSIARVGHYSRLIDLGAAKMVTSITYNGTLPLTNGMVPVTYRAAGADGVFGASTPLSGIGAGITARYVLVNFALDDSMTGVSPDSSGAAAMLADFTVNYAAAASHPSPAQRLRQGQTLQGGVLSPLDTISP